MLGKFNNYVTLINNIDYNISNQDMAKLYGLYKQAKFGNNVYIKPKNSLRDMEKWQAWENERGKSRIQSINEYINLVKTLLTQKKVDEHHPNLNTWSSCIFPDSFRQE